MIFAAQDGIKVHPIKAQELGRRGHASQLPHLRLPQQLVQAHHEARRRQKQTQVHHDARNGHQQIIPPEVLIIPRVHRYGPRPAKPEQKHEQRADGVQVAQGVKAQPSHHLGRRVAAAQGHIAVGQFVQRQGDQYRRKIIQKNDQRAARVALQAGKDAQCFRSLQTFFHPHYT